MICCVGANEHAWLGKGWHARETTPGGLVHRFASDRAVLRIPSASGGSRRLTRVTLLASAPFSALGGDRPVSLSMERFQNEEEASTFGAAKAAPLGTAEFRDDTWKIVRFEIPPYSDREAPDAVENKEAFGSSPGGNTIYLALTTTPALIPARNQSAAVSQSDHRKLGIRFAAFRAFYSPE